MILIVEKMLKNQKPDIISDLLSQYKQEIQCVWLEMRLHYCGFACDKD